MARAVRPPAPSASETLAIELRSTRRRREWTQQDLADRLSAIGASVDRSAIAKIEAGKRGVSVDEALWLAVALGVSPTALLLPRSGGRFQVAPTVVVTAAYARDWFGGEGYLGATAPTAEDWRFFDDARLTDEAGVLRDFPDLRLVRARVAEITRRLAEISSSPKATASVLASIRDATTALRSIARRVEQRMTADDQDAMREQIILERLIERSSPVPIEEPRKDAS